MTDAESSTEMPMDDDPCMHLDMGHMMMSMTFHFGYCENVMFDGWRIRDVGSLIGSIIGIILMATLYEGIKYYREFLHTRSTQHLINEQSSPSKKNNNRPSILNGVHIVQTLLHCLQMILSYFLMLIFMTYNGWLCIAVVAGASLGFFLFGWKKSVVVDVTEHCN